MNADRDPPLRPPAERRAAGAVAWIAGALLVIAAFVIAWDPPPNPDGGAASMALPSLPSLPDPASAPSGSAREDAEALPAVGASGTELIEVCGVGWVPPDASGAADRAAVAGDRDVLASQRALLDALRRRDGEVGDAMATVLELQGGGRDDSAGTPLQALAGCAAASTPGAAAACAGRDEERKAAAALVERLARLAAATQEPRVYALAMQQCQRARSAGSCALLNVDQWARVDGGNALPWLHILQRARDRNDAAQIDEALHHIGASARVEEAPYAIAGRVADRTGTSDVDVIAAQLLAVDALLATPGVEPFVALFGVCAKASLADANRRQACDQAAETLADRSDSLTAVLAGAELGRRLGWPAERVEALRGLRKASEAIDSANATVGLTELPSSCGSARRMLASFSRKARDGEVRAIRAWLASHGGADALAAPSAPPEDAVRADPPAAQAASDAASAPVPVAATPAAAESAASASVPSPDAAASDASPYSAGPPPDR